MTERKLLQEDLTRLEDNFDRNKQEICSRIYEWEKKIYHLQIEICNIRISMEKHNNDRNKNGAKCCH